MKRSKRKVTTKRRNERPTRVRKTSRHLDGIKVVSATDYDLLRRLMTEQGKIMPARLIGASARQQRQIKRAIRRARTMGLLA